MPKEIDDIPDEKMQTTAPSAPIMRQQIPHRRDEKADETTQPAQRRPDRVKTIHLGEVCAHHLHHALPLSRYTLSFPSLALLMPKFA